MGIIYVGAKVAAAIGGACAQDVILTALNAAKPATLSAAKNVAWKVGAGMAAVGVSGAAIDSAWKTIDFVNLMLANKKKEPKKDLNLVSNN